jgi:hypothetical protein
MAQAIGGPRDGVEPFLLDGLTIRQASSERALVDTLQGIPHLSQSCPIGITASKLLIFLLVRDAFIACIASRIIAGFPSPFTGTCELTK